MPEFYITDSPLMYLVKTKTFMFLKPEEVILIACRVKHRTFSFNLQQVTNTIDDWFTALVEQCHFLRNLEIYCYLNFTCLPDNAMDQLPRAILAI
jgi:hypothetical protein